jgi:hypothetical protein
MCENRRLIARAAVVVFAPTALVLGFMSARAGAAAASATVSWVAAERRTP